MTRNLRIFIVFSALLATGYLAVSSLADKLPYNLQWFSSIILIVLFFWLAFDFIVKVIYRMSGVTNKLMDRAPMRLSHQQAALVRKYWLTWLITSLVTGTMYVLIFNISQWKSALVVGAFFTIAVLLGIASSRQRIGGHTKKEIFK